MKKKILLMGLIIISCLSVAMPVWAASTYSFLDYSCPVFLYYDSNNVRKIFMKCDSLVDKAIDYVDAEGKLYKNGSFIASTFDYSEDAMSASDDTPSYTYDHMSYYDSTGVHYAEDYIWYWLFDKYDDETKYSSSGIH